MNTNRIPEANQRFFELKKHGIDTPSAINKVLNGELIACEITEYLNPIECLVLVRSVNMENTINFLKGEAKGTKEIQRLKVNRPDAYFKAVAEQTLFTKPTYQNFVHKILRTLDVSSGEFTVGIAYDPVYQSHYCPADFKEFRTSLRLHSDFADIDAKGWNPIEKMTQQWAFLIKLTQVNGGKTIEISYFIT